MLQRLRLVRYSSLVVTITNMSLSFAGSDKLTLQVKNFGPSTSENPYCNGSSDGMLINSEQSVDGKSQQHFHTVVDIAKGTENVEVFLVTNNSNEPLPKFNYIPHNIVYQNAHVQISLARIADEDCCSGCSGNCLSSTLPCACARETGGEFAYTPEGQLKESFVDSCIEMKMNPQPEHHFYCTDCPIERFKNDIKPEKCKGHLLRKFIKECGRKCGCHMQCGNRIVQRGITCNLQVRIFPNIFNSFGGCLLRVTCSFSPLRYLM